MATVADDEDDEADDARMSCAIQSAVSVVARVAVVVDVVCEAGAAGGVITSGGDAVYKIRLGADMPIIRTTEQPNYCFKMIHLPSFGNGLQVDDIDADAGGE